MKTKTKTMLDWINRNTFEINLV